MILKKQKRKKVKSIKARKSDNAPNISETETAISEYLDVVKSEYQNERNKKVSFENRAGIFFALIGTVCVYLFDKIKLNDIFKSFYTPLTYIVLLKITSGCLIYVSLAFTLFYLIKTITVRQQNNFEVKSIDEILLAENRLDALAKLIFTYRDIIVQHRTNNENRAKTYKLSLYGVVATLMSIIIYVSL